MIFHFRNLVVILCCTILIGCGGKKSAPGPNAEIPPDSLISQDKMVLILADVHVVEAALLLERNKGLDIKPRQDYYYQGVFDKYHITSERYEQNLQFYRQDPDNFAEMYVKVISVLENRQKYIPGTD